KVIDEYRRVHSLKRDIDRVTRLGFSREDDEEADPGLASGDPTASQLAQAEEARDRLLAGLEGEPRQVIELRQEGYSVAEIANQLGWNIRKVQRFLKSLEDSYSRAGGAA
ncbi:MAG: ECF-type sigma factor, partial [Isosphaeraceae bacterium]